MATITPTITNPGPGLYLATWSGIATGDTITPTTVSSVHGIASTVQFEGTFGGATVTLEASNDEANYHAVKDLSAIEISATTAGMYEITSGALSFAPTISGGTGDSVTVTLTLRQ